MDCVIDSRQPTADRRYVTPLPHQGRGPARRVHRRRGCRLRVDRVRPHARSALHLRTGLVPHRRPDITGFHPNIRKALKNGSRGTTAALNAKFAGLIDDVLCHEIITVQHKVLAERSRC